MEVDSRPTELRRVQELWFEDGSLVIQAGNSQYRVYRGILAMYSPVFQDMLSLPQPLDSDLVDNCPLVRLTDAEEEVTSFLKAIFHPTSFPSFPAQTRLCTILGCLRLSHKYEVDHLRRRALIHLSSVYRTKLSKAEVVFRNESKERLPSKTRSWKWTVQDPRSGTAILLVIQVAREVNAPWILPHAFYDLATCYYPHCELARDAHIDDIALYLSPPDQRSFAHGHCQQVISSAANILRFLSHPLKIDGCTSLYECLSLRVLATERNRQNLQINAAMPLELWGSDQWKWLDGLCRSCLVVLKKTHADAREAFWDSLPELYGLPSWEELEKMKADAIGDNLFC
ncbi:BTB domain-containing protein [Mycena sanguinolenta]|uniref:BTB domain-containing protein n=1 Tax=Mycena sanguinolenta TaxID=230812 RepID=A0A8H6YJF7_9AGAR|nr:BTB domain-containing protein [Mycena sanguinolenta]